MSCVVVQLWNRCYYCQKEINTGSLYFRVISVLVIASESRKLTTVKLYTCISSHFDIDAMHVINMESNFVFFLSNQLPSQQKGKKVIQNRQVFHPHVHFAFLHNGTSWRVIICAWLKLLKINKMFTLLIQMVKLQKTLLSNSWPPITRNLTVYDPLQQKLFSLFLKVLSYPQLRRCAKLHPWTSMRPYEQCQLRGCKIQITNQRTKPI